MHLYNVALVDGLCHATGVCFYENFSEHNIVYLPALKVCVGVISKGHFAGETCPVLLERYSRTFNAQEEKEYNVSHCLCYLRAIMFSLLKLVKKYYKWKFYVSVVMYLYCCYIFRLLTEK